MHAALRADGVRHPGVYPGVGSGLRAEAPAIDRALAVVAKQNGVAYEDQPHDRRRNQTIWKVFLGQKPIGQGL